MNISGNTRCIALLGGSFDPVHNGHVALGNYFAKLLAPDELRVIPAGQPWQKNGLHASPQQRVEMLERAFGQSAGPIVIDQQEIRRGSTTYTIDTLRAAREELGPDTSIAFLIGADQLQKLNTWKEWRQLFDYANLCAASRPGFTMDGAHVPAEVQREFARRAATPEQIRHSAHGLTYLATNLSVDISSSQIRSAFERGQHAESLIPAGVLDYIQQHHLYRN